MTPVRTGGLRGARVLVPRGGAWGRRVAEDLTRRGATPVIAPLIASAPPRDLAARDAAFAALAGGDYAWLFVTSAASIEQLVDAGIRVPATTQVAAVGRATARAVAATGAEVAFVPVGQSSAASMITQWRTGRDPRTTGRCLVLRSDLAAATISDELELTGFAVDVCIAYRTVGVDLESSVADDLVAGRIDAVLLTSLSVGRELRRQVPQLPASTLIASIGEGTTRDATALGYAVGHTATTQSVDALIAELDALDLRAGTRADTDAPADTRVHPDAPADARVHADAPAGADALAVADALADTDTPSDLGGPHD